MLNRWLKLPTLLTAVLLTGSLLSGCSDTTLASKTLTEDVSFPVPGSPISFGVITLPPIDIPIDPASQPAYDADDLNYVTSVTVKDITFTVNPESTEPGFDANDDGNLDTFEFVSTLKLSLVATVDGELVVEPIATLPMSDPQIASNATTLSMDVEDTDIRDLIEAEGGCQLRIEITGTAPPDTVSVDAAISFRLGLGIR